MRWVVTPRPGRFIPGKDPAPIAQEAGWASEPVWTGAENLAQPGFLKKIYWIFGQYNTLSS